MLVTLCRSLIIPRALQSRLLTVPTGQPSNRAASSLVFLQVAVHDEGAVFLRQAVEFSMEQRPELIPGGPILGFLERDLVIG